MRFWAILLAISSSAAAEQGERSILLHVNENPPLRVESAILAGQLCAELYRGVDCHRPVRIEMEKTADFLTVKFLDGNRTSSLKISSSDLPDIDLSSAAVSGHYRPDIVVIVELRFGRPSDCYINDDGRSLLSVSFRKEGAAVRVVSYEGCKVVERQVAGEQGSR